MYIVINYISQFKFLRHLTIVIYFFNRKSLSRYIIFYCCSAVQNEYILLFSELYKKNIIIIICFLTQLLWMTAKVTRFSFHMMNISMFLNMFFDSAGKWVGQEEERMWSSWAWGAEETETMSRFGECVCFIWMLTVHVTRLK